MQIVHLAYHHHVLTCNMQIYIRCDNHFTNPITGNCANNTSIMYAYLQHANCAFGLWSSCTVCNMQIVHLAYHHHVLTCNMQTCIRCDHHCTNPITGNCANNTSIMYAYLQHANCAFGLWSSCTDCNKQIAHLVFNHHVTIPASCKVSTIQLSCINHYKLRAYSVNSCANNNDIYMH